MAGIGYGLMKLKKILRKVIKEYDQATQGKYFKYNKITRILFVFLLVSTYILVTSLAYFY